MIHSTQLNVNRSVLFLTAAVMLLAVASAVAAEAPADRSCGPRVAFLATGGSEDPTSGAVTMARSGSIDGPSAQSDCTAQCQDGTTVTCSGSSCSAVDYSCMGNERGQCTGSSGTEYCPALDIDQCPVTCTASKTCPDGTYLYCEGHFGTSACEGGADFCYVMCDGGTEYLNYQWCPGYFNVKYCGF